MDWQAVIKLPAYVREQADALSATSVYFPSSTRHASHTADPRFLTTVNAPKSSSLNNHRDSLRSPWHCRSLFAARGPPSVSLFYAISILVFLLSTCLGLKAESITTALSLKASLPLKSVFSPHCTVTSMRQPPAHIVHVFKLHPILLQWPLEAKQSKEQKEGLI